MIQTHSGVETLAQAKIRYAEIRVNVHRSIAMDFRQIDPTRFNNLTVTGVTPRAIQTFGSEWKAVARRVQWDWENEIAYWKKKRACHWEMAIWHKQVLCGLVVGGPSRRGTRLYIEGIEGNPEPHPLNSSILPIALIASEKYALSIGAKEVWVKSPAMELVDRYSKLGYTLRPPNRVLAKIFGKTSFAVKQVE